VSSDSLGEGGDNDDHKLNSVLKRKEEGAEEVSFEGRTTDASKTEWTHHLLSSDDISEPSEEQLSDEGSDGGSD
jgi:hypothetical protein